MNHLFSERILHIAVTVTAILQISFFLFCTVLVIRHLSARTNRSEEKDRPEYYISVQIHSGESLWDISKRYYSSEYKSMNQYIRKIKYLNHLSDESICAGSYLIIPYYE